MPTSTSRTRLVYGAAIVSGLAITIGCATIFGGASAPLKVISIPCRVPITTYETKTREALVKAGFTLTPDPSQPSEIEASRPAIYTGVGEGLQMNGPYRWDSRYSNNVISVTVQTVHVNPDGSVYPAVSHDENAAPSDRRHFLPVIQALREMCRES